MNENPEVKRLEAARHHTTAWKKWGPYLSERQWGTVREDYSADGNAGITLAMIRPGPALSLR